MGRSALRFGIEVPQDAPFPVLQERWRQAEDVGFDDLYVADHLGDPRNLDGYWLDGWATLAAMATATTRIRVGMLVTSPILHPPAAVARAAVSLDHLSGGRLELGIGAGIAEFDHAAAGVSYWSPRERAARFAEYVEIVDGLLRARRTAYEFHGRHYRVQSPALVPPPLQRPRPPITVGGQSPTVLRSAAAYADCWNTHGRFGAPFEQVVEALRRQNDELDALCGAAGRDPGTLRRSLLLLKTGSLPEPGLDAWASRDAFERIVSRFVEVGMREFVVFWPRQERLDVFEHVATQVLPALRSA